MNILLDDVPYNNSLYPFTAVRSLVHIRVGILTIYEKWQLAFPGEVILSSQLPENEEIYSGYLKIQANLIPSIKFFERIRSTGQNALVTDDCKILRHPWEIFEYNDWAIREDFEIMTSGRDSRRNKFREQGM